MPACPLNPQACDLQQQAALAAAAAACRPSQTPADVKALLEAARQRPGTGSSGMLGSEVGACNLHWCLMLARFGATFGAA